MRALEASEDEKFNILINRLGLNSYEYVDATTTYKEAVEKLENVYSKKVYKIYARWKLASEKQREGESMDAFANRLMILAKDCDYRIYSNKRRTFFGLFLPKVKGAALTRVQCLLEFIGRFHKFRLGVLKEQKLSIPSPALSKVCTTVKSALV